MSDDHKITDLKYHLKGLVNKQTCKELIKFFEDHKHMTVTEKSIKYPQNKLMTDNCSFLYISQMADRPGFDKVHDIICKYLRIVLTNYEIYVRNNLCPTYINHHMLATDNIRIIKYDVGQNIIDHSDVDEYIRGSLTINLNDDYEGGEFRFFGGELKIDLSEGEAMLFPAEPIWIHGTEPISKGARYAINCFLKQK